MNKETVNEKISEWNRQHLLTPEQRNKLIQDKVERAKLILLKKSGSERVVGSSH